MHNGTRRSVFSPNEQGGPSQHSGVSLRRTLTRKSTRQRNRSYFRIVARSVGQFGSEVGGSGLGQPRVMSKGGGGGHAGPSGGLVEASVSVLNAVCRAAKV
jgi:hypothetical protein